MSIDQAYTGLGGYSFGQDDYSLMQFIAQQAVNGMTTATPAEVVAVNEDDTVDVKPMVHQIDGAGNATPHGVINGLPVFAMRAGPCVIRIKPRVGDIGQVVFCHNDISGVKKAKVAGAPSSRRRFDWSDGIYYGGVLPKTAPTTIIEIDDDDNVVITAPTIKLNGDVQITGDVAITGAVDVAGDVTMSDTLTVDTDVVADGKSLASHTHDGVTPGTGTSGPPS